MEQISSAGLWGLCHCCLMTDVSPEQLQRPSEEGAWERGRITGRARPGRERSLSHWTKTGRVSRNQPPKYQEGVINDCVLLSPDFVPRLNLRRTL